jgi:Arc/MetJ family transcription regulator
MRTTIEIDDELLSRAMKATGLPTKRATVEAGLRLLVRVRKQARALAELEGLGWEGDLNEMRQSRRPTLHALNARLRRRSRTTSLDAAAAVRAERDSR